MVAEAFHEAFPGCTSDWSKVGNSIDDPEAQVRLDCACDIVVSSLLLFGVFVSK